MFGSAVDLAKRQSDAQANLLSGRFLFYGHEHCQLLTSTAVARSALHHLAPPAAVRACVKGRATFVATPHWVPAAPPRTLLSFAQPTWV